MQDHRYEAGATEHHCNRFRHHGTLAICIAIFFFTIGTKMFGQELSARDHRKTPLLKCDIYLRAIKPPVNGCLA